ncbi:MAG: DUF6261 family protein [Tannerella sp.]|jgi:hypothetical protein|nr:DUF6261 family protein [Tannerella sp.]
MKRQIIGVHFESLRNEAHVELNEAVIAAIDKHNPAQLGIGDIYAGYRQLVTTEISLLDMMHRNGFTMEIHAQDRVCGRIFHGLADAVNSGLNHFDAGKREAAGKLFVLFERYGHITARTPDEETAVLDNFLRELASDTASDPIRTLGLTDWTERLAQENGKFKELMQAYDSEAAQRPSLRVHAVRTDVDRALRTILNYLDVVTTVHGFVFYELLVNELNAVFERYRNIPVQ